MNLQQFIQALEQADKNFDTPTGSNFIAFDETGQIDRLRTIFARLTLDTFAAQANPTVKTIGMTAPSPFILVPDRSLWSSIRGILGSLFGR